MYYDTYENVFKRSLAGNSYIHYEARYKKQYKSVADLGTQGTHPCPQAKISSFPCSFWETLVK